MSTAVGVGIGVVGKAVASLGLVLQKRSHQRNLDGKHFCCDARWLAAFLTYFAGNLIVIVALVLAPQVIIAALDSLVMVFNAILAPQMLDGELLTTWDIGSCLVTICGVCLVVYYGPEDDAEYTDDELIELLKEKIFIGFACGCVVLCGMLQVSLFVHEKKYSKNSLLDDATKVGSLAAVAAGSIPAILSAFNLQLSKICGELISTSFRTENQFDNWPVYMFLALLILCNTLQVITLQRALADYAALLIIPVFQVQLTIFAVINGGIYFKEFNTYTSIFPPIMFCTGVTLCILGIAILSARKWRGVGVAATPATTPHNQDISLVKSISFGLLNPAGATSSALLTADTQLTMVDEGGFDDKDYDDSKMI